MPVTAKLSLLFYEKLGEQVATELVDWFNSVDATYRSDLRELNELNFARFDAKLEQRLAELGAGLRTEFGQRLNALDAKLEQRFAELKAELLTDFGQRLNALDTKLEQRVAELRGEVGTVRQDIRDGIANLRSELIKWSFVFFATAALAVIGLR